MYVIFNDPFYYGYFPWCDPETGEIRQQKGSHQAMITEKEYRRAQVLLGKHGKPQPKNREFAFTGIMRCGECDSTITAEEKNQIICTTCKFKFAYENKTLCPKCQTDISDMKNPTILNYVYYHCTKKKNRNCTQKSVKIGDLETQFKKILQDITIDEDYLKLALDYLHDKQTNSGDTERTARQSLQATYDSCQTRLVNLNKAFTSPMNSNYELYTLEDFRQQKSALLEEIKKLEEQMGDTKKKLLNDLEVSERVFNFCAFSLRHFNTDDLQKKREIFNTIGSNLILKDKILSIERLHPYMLIENELRSQKALCERLEPKKDGSTKEKEAVFVASLPNWLRRQDSNL